MKSNSIIFGIIIGFLLMGIIVWIAMPPMMINVHKSQYEFDETVAAVEKAVTAQQGWKVSKVFDIQKNIIDAGHQDMTRVKIVTLCNPHYANRILSDDKDKVVTTMMPLGIGVYETRDYIHKLGGDLEVISRVGEGTTFRIRLAISDTP